MTVTSDDPDQAGGAMHPPYDPVSLASLSFWAQSPAERTTDAVWSVRYPS